MDQKIHKITRKFANFYILEGDGLTVVDTGPGWKVQTLQNEFRRLNLDPHHVKLILITHGHCDHFGSLDTFLKVCGNPPVMCHRDAVRALETGISRSVTPTSRKSALMAFLGSFFMHTKVHTIPTYQITQDTDLTEFGIQAQVLPTPGHTSCSLSVILQKGDAILGDALMPSPKNHPGHPWFLENERALKDSYGRLIQTLSGTCYTGHGGPFTSREVIGFMNRYLNEEIGE